ncbi:MAG: homogentisate 1,2-dioxygenase domain-containing protein [Planctomycetota bacterium]
MPFYTQLGSIPKKRHVQFRRPDGALYSEELFGTEGFVGPTSTLYHVHPPTQVSGWKPIYKSKPEYVEQDVMRMRHTMTQHVKPQGDPVTGRVVLFGNSDVEMGICNPAETMPYHFKNGQGDECLFVHFGSGTVRTMFGTLKFAEKDYIVIPKGTIYHMEFDARPDDGSDNERFGGYSKADMPFGKMVTFETANGSHILPPPRYLSKQTSQFLEHAPYCERDLVIPFSDDANPLCHAPLDGSADRDYEVRIKARDTVHSYMYSYHPLDVVGWDGCYYPYTFNIAEFAPITGKLHMPPPIHQTFEGHNFVICSFCPRMLDFHPEAIPVPYNHSNIDSDEILYYVEGNYKARRGITSGSISVHPQGIPHGPHPGTVEKSLGKTYTDELAVMCDTFRPMFPTKAAVDMDDPNYPDSWREDHHAPLQKDGQNGQAKPGATVNTWD